MDKNKKKFLIIGGVILAIVILIIADKSFKSRQAEKQEDAPNATESVENAGLDTELGDEAEDAGDDKNDSANNGEDAANDDTSANAGDDTSANAGDDASDAGNDSSDSSTNSANVGDNSSEASDNSGNSDASSDDAGNAGDKNTDENTASQEVSYEHWLAAGAVTAVSMYYMDFELEGIYLASETTMGNHAGSKGVYVAFTSGGEKMIVQSVPLEEERDEAGTVDLSTENFGFATFDRVRVSNAELKKYKEVRLENLSSLINQLMLVTLYEH